jgi:hypothetical protein
MAHRKARSTVEDLSAFIQEEGVELEGGLILLFVICSLRSGVLT